MPQNVPTKGKFFLFLFVVHPYSMFSIDSLAWTFFLYSLELLNRCLPGNSEKQTNKFFSKTGIREFFQEVHEDITACLDEIFYMFAIAFRELSESICPFKWFFLNKQFVFNYIFHFSGLCRHNIAIQIQC